MKLALACAVAVKADSLLSYELTTHFDKKNVSWLENYLISLTQVTATIASQASVFMDGVWASIIKSDFNLKLKSYLCEFVTGHMHRPRPITCS